MKSSSNAIEFDLFSSFRKPVMPSILDPFCCGFGKIILIECCDRNRFNKNSSVVDISNVLKSGLEHFVELMNEGNGFDVKRKWFNDNTKKIKTCLETLGKRAHATRKQLMDGFSSTAWLKLSVAQRGRHSLFECKGCLNNENLRSMLRLFPINKDGPFLKKAEDGGLFKPSKEEMRALAAERIGELNEEFSANHGCSFEEAL
eukprot:TCONS_00018123-protein